MIIVMGEIRVGEGAIEQARDAIAKMEVASLQEAGCELYSFSQCVSDPSLLRISERWTTMDDLAAHFAEPHMAEFQASLASVEILGMDEDHFYFRYHRAKNPADAGRFMIYRRDDEAYWLDQLEPVGKGVLHVA